VCFSLWDSCLGVEKAKVSVRMGVFCRRGEGLSVVNAHPSGWLLPRVERRKRALSTRLCLFPEAAETGALVGFSRRAAVGAIPSSLLGELVTPLDYWMMEHEFELPPVLVGFEVYACVCGVGYCV
jgi:hypothetical protein